MISKYPIEVTISFTKIEIFDKYFKDKYFGFISNRVNDYTVNPTCFSKISINRRLLGVAILCYSKESYENTQYIKCFYSRPFKSFFSLKECIQWFDSLSK